MIKQIFWVFLFSCTILQAQAYLDVSVDPNKIFNVIDNPRTQNDHQGLDWDIELGVTSPTMGLYIYYGRFEAMKWQNYGIGVDYYLTKGKSYDISMGLQLNKILRHVSVYDGEESMEFRDGWTSSLGFGGRLVGVLWLSEHIGLSGRLQYITRPDLPQTFGIIEGSIGIRYKYN